VENYWHDGNDTGTDEDLNELRQGLPDLLEEDAKYDKLRSLPLYICRNSGWKFVCSKC